jgi:hypothetical protein
MIVSVVLLLKSTLQGVTDTPLVQVMVESNDSAHTGGTTINALVNTEASEELPTTSDHRVMAGKE